MDMRLSQNDEIDDPSFLEPGTSRPARKWEELERAVEQVPEEQTEKDESE